MPMHLIQRIAGKRANRLFLLAGILLTCFSLYQLLLTAMYIQECIIVPAKVTDVVQKPFESTCEAWQHGNAALGGSTSYQAIVHYTLPNGLVIDRLMTDADDSDYTVGQQVEIITPEVDPSRAHINKWKFLWGWNCMTLGGGIFLLLLGLMLRERQTTREEATQHSGRKPTSKSKKTNSSRAPRKSAPRRKKAV
jgi:hypothetical protein